MKPIAVLIALFLAGTAFADRYRDAVDHPGRPAIDREDDDRRKPAQVMAFAGVSAGETVLEVGAGRGYTTELTARLVGPDGTVYAHGLDPARVVGNRLPNVMTVPAQPSDLGERFAAAGMKRGGVDRVLAFSACMTATSTTITTCKTCIAHCSII
jgi:predicted methyltransferase